MPPVKTVRSTPTVAFTSVLVITKGRAKVFPMREMFEFEKTVFAPYRVHTVPVTPRQLEIASRDCKKEPPLKFNHVVYTGVLVRFESNKADPASTEVPSRAIFTTRPLLIESIVLPRVVDWIRNCDVMLVSVMVTKELMSVARTKLKRAMVLPVTVRLRLVRGQLKVICDKTAPRTSPNSTNGEKPAEVWQSKFHVPRTTPIVAPDTPT